MTGILHSCDANHVENLAVNYVAERLGAEQYKHYRIYQMPV
jgi:hypothetical protein